MGGVAFLRRQLALADPLIDVRLFRVPAFAVGMAANVVTLFSVFGALLFVAQYLQLVLGLSPLEAGLWTPPSAADFVVGPCWRRRCSAGPTLRRPLVFSLMVAAGGFAVLSQVRGSTSLAVLVTGWTVVALGVAPVMTLAADMVVGSVSPRRAGAASAWSETGAELGGAIGIAVLGSIGVAVYRGEVADFAAVTLSPGVQEVAADTLAGALTVTPQVPGLLGVTPGDAAKTAFTSGLRVSAAICVGIVTGMAIVAAISLRRVRQATVDGAAPAPPSLQFVRAGNMPSSHKVARAVRRQKGRGEGCKRVFENLG